MKHLKTFFESLSEKQSDDLVEITASLIDISDDLGDPIVRSLKWGESTRWEFVWVLKTSLSVPNNIKLIDTLFKKIYYYIEDIEVTSRRFKNYSFDVRFNNIYLEVYISPLESNKEFGFIDELKSSIKGKNSIYYISEMEVIRYFKKMGVTISTFRESYEDEDESYYIVITCSSPDLNANRAMDGFIDLVNAEFTELGCNTSLLEEINSVKYYSLRCDDNSIMLVF